MNMDIVSYYASRCFVSATCFASAAYLSGIDKPGWGWLLFLGFLFLPLWKGGSDAQ